MLSVSPATRVFVALAAVDMRRSFNGLYAQVQTVLGQDPLICVAEEYVAADQQALCSASSAGRIGAT